MANPESSSLTTEPLEVRPGCWMVGYRNPTSLLQCNTYLRVFEEGDTKIVCIDPGSRQDFAAVKENICRVVGGLEAIDAFTLNHQDPDVVGNSPAFCDANPRINAVVSEDVWRLVQHLDFKPGSVSFANTTKPIERFGQRLQIVPTPFCHFRGAIAFYDPEIRTLFSGDLFGGLNQTGRVHLFAEPDDWIGIAQFHQIYMPSRAVLRYAVRQIRALQPAVEVIAPQHGHVIAGDSVAEFLDRMEELLVGHDLFEAELDESYLDLYTDVIRDLFAWMSEAVGNDDAHRRLRPKLVADDIGQILQVKGDDLKVLKDGYSGLAKVFSRFCLGEPPEFQNAMREFVFFSLRSA